MNLSDPVTSACVLAPQSECNTQSSIANRQQDVSRYSRQDTAHDRAGDLDLNGVGTAAGWIVQ